MTTLSAFTLLLLPAGLLTVSAAAQTPGSPVQLKQPSPQSVRLHVQNPTQQTGKVQVRSLASGRTLFVERYSGSAYGHRFEFQQLPAGRYALLVKNGGQRYRYELHLRDGAARSLEIVAPPRDVVAVAGR